MFLEPSPAPYTDVQMPRLQDAMKHSIPFGYTTAWMRPKGSALGVQEVERCLEPKSRAMHGAIAEVKIAFLRSNLNS
ncbi:hypothetical protein Ga0074115_10492 [endosymbiont of Ridgeia piscesae]|uniref:Uncharacterized protein n=1 Tax=endosymbiont of Ridgeia piscesae TaxID=54398 RepID=A0A0T5YUM7_9GAMM|nr:hypothetical protein Ga0074115_10492 [endosymbiont of Ridgeia piscesae]